MTGYGDAEGVYDGVTYAVEIKTVNNRYLKTKIKVPEQVAFVEEDIDRLLRNELSRGSVNYTLRLKDISTEALFDIDQKGLESYARKLKKAADRAGIKADIDLTGLLNVPGIIQPKEPDEEEAERIREFVKELSTDAIEKLKHMRAIEGEALAVDLRLHGSEIREYLSQITEKSDLLPVEYHKKLKRKVEKLLTDVKVEVDESILAREVAIYAERVDISEELARLESHIVQMDEALVSDDLAGKRLDFLSQEMLREANTIASKASDTEIVHLVVDVKVRIDRIKEQVQNVE